MFQMEKNSYFSDLCKEVNFGKLIATQEEDIKEYNLDKYLIILNLKNNFIFVLNKENGNISFFNKDNVISVTKDSTNIFNNESTENIITMNKEGTEIKSNDSMIKMKKDGKMFIYASEKNDLILSGKVVRISSEAMIVNGEYVVTSPMPNLVIKSKEGIPIKTRDTRHKGFRNILKVAEDLKKKIEDRLNGNRNKNNS